MLYRQCLTEHPTTQIRTKKLLFVKTIKGRKCRILLQYIKKQFERLFESFSGTINSFATKYKKALPTF